MDKTSKEVIPLIYDNFLSFSEGLAVVEKRANMVF
ncbi:MAG: WG repeat-containing protein [Bacteroidetes bacterium]|nr:WG repeat-containing protein [Bacteroidota bacterium]